METIVLQLEEDINLTAIARCYPEVAKTVNQGIMRILQATNYQDLVDAMEGTLKNIGAKFPGVIDHKNQEAIAARYKLEKIVVYLTTDRMRQVEAN